MREKSTLWKVAAFLLALILVNNPEVLCLFLTVEALGVETVLLFLAFQGREMVSTVFSCILRQFPPHWLTRRQIKYLGLLVLVLFFGGGSVPLLAEVELLTVVFLSTINLAVWCSPGARCTRNR